MRRAIIFAFCFAVLLCVPAFAETVEPDPESSSSVVVDSSAAGGDPAVGLDESGLDTVVIEQSGPLEVMAIDDVSPAAVTGSGYTGMMGDQYRDYFSAVVSKYWGRDYVAYRSGQYTYTLVYDADLEVSSSRFTGSGKSVVINTGSYNTGDWSVDWNDTDSVNLSLNDVALYSNLADYPQLEGGEWIEKTAALVVCLGALALFTCGILFGRVRS